MALLSNKFLLAGALAASTLASGCATTIGGANVSYQPPTDIIGKTREAFTQGRPQYVFTHVENANQGAFGGCGANAIFVPNRGSNGFGSTSYLHLNAKELNNLLTNGVTKDAIAFTRHAHQFDRGQLEAALTAVQVQMDNNASTRRCFGYN